MRSVPGSAIALLAVLGLACGQRRQQGVPTTRTVRLNTGQLMPLINCGGTSQAVKAGDHYSNYSEFLRQGGRGLDTALTYTDPVNLEIGAAIKAHPEIARAELFVTSKLPCCAPIAPRGSCLTTTASGFPINSSIADTMRYNNKMLGLAATDLTLLHFPCQNQADSIARWLEMEAALKVGLTKAIGVSNFPVDLLEAMASDKRVTVVPAANQCNHAIANHNATHRPAQGGDDATVKYCQARGISYSAYSPLEGLSGGSVMQIPQVVAIGKAHGVSAAQVAFRWLLQQDISAVTAAHDPGYIKEDLDVFGFELTPAEMATLSAI